MEKQKSAFRVPILEAAESLKWRFSTDVHGNIVPMDWKGLTSAVAFLLVNVQISQEEADELLEALDLEWRCYPSGGRFVATKILDYFDRPPVISAPTITP